jgi:hypothetical protein
MKKLFAVIALASSMGVAYAAEPVALTDGQMDNVSAGGTAVALADALAVGKVAATAYTITDTAVLGLVRFPTQAGSLLVDTGAAYSKSFASAL